MVTKKDTKTQRWAIQVRAELLRVIKDVGTVEADWKLFRKKEIGTLSVTTNVRLAADLISRHAETNCRHIVGQVIFGLAALDRGDMQAADHALNTCWRLIRFDNAADDVLHTLLADAFKEVTRG
jgi:hypothetical protein